jgi:hypothetical protein
MIEISCPSSCSFLSLAEAHPPAVVRKQQEHDALFLAAAVDGLSPRQQELGLVVLGFMTGAGGDALLRVTDEDARQACEALASTFETSGKGLIYEHRPDSLTAQRLTTDARRFLQEVGTQGGRAFEADAALVLRRLARAIEQVRRRVDEGPSTCLDMAGRMLKVMQREGTAAGTKDSGAATPADEARPRIITTP